MPPRRPAATAGAMAQAASPQAIAEYRRKLKEYQEARAAFEAAGRRLLEFDRREAAGPQRQAARASAIALDDYVLTQPPVYTGPKRPVNPEPEAAGAEKPPRERKIIPVVADLLKAAAGAFPVRAAAARERGRVQARLCPRCARRQG